MDSGFKRHSRSRAAEIFRSAFTVASCLRLDPDQAAASTLNSAKMNTASHLTIAEGAKHYETPRSHPVALAWIISSALFPWARPGYGQAPDRDYDCVRHSKRCRA